MSSGLAERKRAALLLLSTVLLAEVQGVLYFGISFVVLPKCCLSGCGSGPTMRASFVKLEYAEFTVFTNETRLTKRKDCTSSHKPRIRYRTCNTQDCSPDSQDFRALQCAAFDDTPYQGKLHQWLPHLGDYHHPCALYCRANNTNVVALMSPKVLDGTRCRDDSYDMCVNGTCKSVGCDGQFDSNKRLDVCGKCGGDGSSCRLVTGLYRAKPRKHFGSEDVIVVPRNSRHISVSERGSGHVGLKLTDSSEAAFLIAPKNNSRSKGVVRTSGILVRYGSFSYGKEYFDVPGPVPGELKVVAVYDDEVWKYIRYEFYRPLEVFWKHDETGVDCTATCGGGLQYLWPICADIVTGRKRDEQDCYNEGIVPPSPKVHRCNVYECPVNAVCPRPASARSSNTSGETDPWTECSKSCAGGIQTRTISCAEDSISGEALITVDDSPCHAAGLPVPESRRGCNDFPCPSWAALSWSECSATCGKGWQYRVVQCRSHNGKAAFNCDDDKKPHVTRACLATTPCFVQETLGFTRLMTKAPRRQAALVQPVKTISPIPSWITDQWGYCSVTCGTGMMSRTVACRAFMEFSRTVEDLPDDACNGTKPETRKSCALAPCNEPRFSSLGEHEGNGFDEASNDNSRYSNSGGVASRLASFDSHVTYKTNNFSDRSLFDWRYDESGDCLPPCGNGTKILRQICVHLDSGSLVAPDRCDAASKKEDKAILCISRPCDTTLYDGNATTRNILACVDQSC